MQTTEKQSQCKHPRENRTSYLSFSFGKFTTLSKYYVYGEVKRFVGDGTVYLLYFNIEGG